MERAEEFEQIIRAAYPKTGHSWNGGNLDDQFETNCPTPSNYHEPLFNTIYYLLFASMEKIDKFPFFVRLLKSDGGPQEFDIYYRAGKLVVFLGNVTLNQDSQGFFCLPMQAKTVQEFCKSLVEIEKWVYLQIHKVARELPK